MEARRDAPETSFRPTIALPLAFWQADGTPVPAHKAATVSALVQALAMGDAIKPLHLHPPSASGVDVAVLDFAGMIYRSHGTRSSWADWATTCLEADVAPFQNAAVIILLCDSDVVSEKAFERARRSQQQRNTDQTIKAAPSLVFTPNAAPPAPDDWVCFVNQRQHFNSIWHLLLDNFLQLREKAGLDKVGFILHGPGRDTVFHPPAGTEVNQAIQQLLINAVYVNTTSQAP
jgi:hypothetical protein